MAQTPLRDSLRQVLETQEGVTRLQTLNRLAWDHLRDQPHEARRLAEQSLAYDEVPQLHKTRIVPHNIIAISYGKEGLEEEALKYLFRALRLADSLDDVGSQIGITNNIGIIHSNQQDYTRALTWFRKSLALTYSSVNALHIRLSTLGNMAENFQRLGQLDSALHYARWAWRASRTETVPPALHAQHLRTLAAVHVETGAYDSARVMLNKAWRIYSEQNDHESMVDVLMTRAAAHEGLDNLTAARNDYERSLELARADSLLPQEVQILEQFHSFLNRLGERVAAYERLRELMTARKRLSDEQSRRSREEMEARYALEQKNQAIELLRTENHLQQQRLLGLYFGGIAILIILGLVVYLYIQQLRSKQRQREHFRMVVGQRNALSQQAEALHQANEEIRAQKDQIERQRETLEQSYDELKELIVFREAMTGMIVHDLKTPLASIIGLTEPYLHLPDIASVQQAGRQMLNLVLNILDVQKLESTQVVPTTKPVRLTEIAEQASQQVAYLAHEQGIQIEHRLAEGLAVDVDPDMIERVLVNLLTNALKFTGEGGTVTLMGRQVLEQVYVSVKDTGAGIAPDQLPYIFDKFVQVDPKTRGRTRSTGLGLTFCRMAIRAHGGDIAATSQPGQGTTFTFNLPVAHASVPDTYASEPPGHIEPRTLEKGGPLTNTGELSWNLGPLSPETCRQLQPIVEALVRLPVYRTTEIMRLLQAWPEEAQGGLKSIRQELETAVLGAQSGRYYRTLDLLRQACSTTKRVRERS